MQNGSLHEPVLRGRAGEGGDGGGGIVRSGCHTFVHVDDVDADDRRAKYKRTQLSLVFMRMQNSDPDRTCLALRESVCAYDEVFVPFAPNMPTPSTTTTGGIDGGGMPVFAEAGWEVCLQRARRRLLNVVRARYLMLFSFGEMVLNTIDYNADYVEQK